MLRIIQPIEVAEYKTNLTHNNQNFKAAINNGVLPVGPGVEIHPYLNEVPLSNYDKCIAGTFPPISYLTDELNLKNLIQPNKGGKIAPPCIPWFHGNSLAISMWKSILDPEAFLKLVEMENNEARLYLIDYLIEHRMNYSDIIYSTKRKLKKGKYDASDKNLFNIVVNEDLIKHTFRDERKLLLKKRAKSH